MTETAAYEQELEMAAFRYVTGPRAEAKAATYFYEKAAKDSPPHPPAPHAPLISMEFSGMTQKWSSKPKEHKAARIRDNQRRHRARTKAYIADLERQLAEVHAQLDEALKRNAGLTSELEQLRAGCADKPAANGPNEVADDGTLKSSVAAVATPSNLTSVSRSDKGSPSSPLLLPDDDASISTLNLSGLLAPKATRHISIPDDEGSPPARTKIAKHKQSHSSPQPSTCSATCCPGQVTLATISSQGSTDLAVLQSGWSHLPPPALGESTIPCKTAYDIIEQQNYKGLDLSVTRGFLAPGFRRATIRGDGCRVETNRVFSVIDAINS